uniref:NAC domain-containing protein n=1 Tax=Haemonchus contortus TaxID=6289 RepID=A0A7I4YAQ4_HAECO
MRQERPACAHPSTYGPYYFDVRFGDLDPTKTGWTCYQRHSTRSEKDKLPKFLTQACIRGSGDPSSIKNEDQECQRIGKKSKFRWGRQVMQYHGNRWTRMDTDRIPRDIKRTTTADNTMVRLLHQSSGRNECYASCPSSWTDTLDYSGSRQERM